MRPIEKLEQALQELEDHAYHPSMKPDISAEAHALAIVVIQEKLARENPQPLTLDELRGMVSKWVWLNARVNHPAGTHTYKGWGKVIQSHPISVAILEDCPSYVLQGAFELGRAKAYPTEPPKEKTDGQ